MTVCYGPHLCLQRDVIGKQTWQFLSDSEEYRGLGVLKTEKQVKEERLDRALKFRDHKTIKKLENKLGLVHKIYKK